MVSWTRDTLWRQGSLISRDDLAALDLPVDDRHAFGLVISHDCDLASCPQSEPVAEIILPEAQDEPDPNYTYSKNPRCLHFSICGENGDELVLEARATNKFSVGKERLVCCSPVQDAALGSADLDILQRWLACRYRRQALPNALMERMGSFLNRIKRQTGRQFRSVVGVWISFDPPTEADEDTPYELDVYFVYSTDDEPDAAENAMAVAEAIRLYFDESFSSDADGKNEIYLGRCEAVAEDGFTLRDMRRNVELKMEYLSYRSSEGGPMTP